ncbi:MAG: 2-C-methyl-D-erythritol 2,4-cyclodiphosphate synthase, partial [Pseudomonadota bacterium]
DESSLMKIHDFPISYIPGDRDNIKISFKEDLKMKLEIRSGIGFDAHKFAENISMDNHVMLGGVKIPYERKLEAHSDGDVLIHSLVDAILGAIGEGDIGLHFPPSDAKWKNANSVMFLEFANNLVKQKNGAINNIDVTVICEKPRLSQYKDEIKNNLAKILSITSDRVNVKATTTEKMGFTGRGEGIAVQAIATISLSVI